MSDDEQQEQEHQQQSSAPDYGESDQVAKAQGDRCPRCGDRAYHAESIAMEGAKFHKRCFACKECKKKLDSTNASSHEGEVFCKGCHASRFGIKGYGYGIGAGALTRTQ